jgi:hypothetical protein
MGTITIDFSAVPDFQPLPSGDYAVVIDHVEVRQGQTSGQPYLNFDLVVAEGEYEGRHLFTTSSLKENSLWRLKALLDSFSLMPEDGQISIETDEDSGYVLSPEFSGQPGIAAVVLTTYQGRKSNEVSDLRGYEQTPVEQVKAPAVKSPSPIASRPGSTPAINAPRPKIPLK